MKKTVSLPFLLAFRFVRSSAGERNIAVMIKICFLSILFGTFALTMVAAIMNGFEKATHEKLQGINADALIRSTHPLNFEKLSIVLQNEFGNLIQAYSPTSSAQVIIQHDHNNSRFQHLVALKAIDPVRESKVTALNKMIINTDFKSLEQLAQRNTILIGHALAEQLQIKVGDTVSLLYPTDTQIQAQQITLDSRSATIIALFKTGIDEFDEHVIYTSLDFFNDLFDLGITQVAVKFNEQAQADKIVSLLKKRLSLDVFSWKELYPAIVSALTLEKYVMFIILTLMTFVLSINVISLLFMFITQKKGEIALLKTMGMADSTLVILFIALGMIITLCAAIIGIMLACFICLILHYYPIKLPDAYYVSHLPALMDWTTVATISLIIFLVSLFSAWFPAYRTRFIKLAHVLKTEH